MSAPLIDVPRISVTVGATSRQYVIVETSAPGSYDGFNTVPIEVLGNGHRLLLVEVQNYDWQIGRYDSGGYVSKCLIDERINHYVEQELLLRMKRLNDTA